MIWLLVVVDKVLVYLGAAPLYNLAASLKCRIDINVIYDYPIIPSLALKYTPKIISIGLCR